ncbi:ABC transporter substrate-binding protein [Aeromicrobium sp. UC242_57]|uniref:ABC transporter substrate-binding protein n=1 Tax=Aeromicrobium sp. UC242_57 TaxID=3374624 RepID=UPI00379605B1
MKVYVKRVRSLAAITLASALVLSACGDGGGDKEKDDDTFSFVAVLALSGPLSESGGIPSRNALETGIKILNADGGIDGRQVKLTTVDSAGDATKAVANLQAYLSDNPKPDAVFGGQYSFEALPMAPILTQAEVLSLSSSVTPVLDDPKKFPFAFQQSIPPSTILSALATHISDEGHKKVAYIAVDDESGHTSVDAFKSVAKEGGLEVVDGYIPANSLDATSVLEKLRAAKPDVLVMSAVGPAAATMLKSRTDIKWDVPAIGDGSAFAANDLGKISKPEYWDGVTVQAADWNVEGSAMTSTRPSPSSRRPMRTSSRSTSVSPGSSRSTSR